MTIEEKLSLILFAHSAGPQYGKGKGNDDLMKYLQSNLAEDFSVKFPAIEKPGAPAYAKYKKMFKAFSDQITDPICLIGHSLGASVLLKYLSEEHPAVSIAGLFLVSTPHWTGDMKEFELKVHFETAIKDIPIFLYHSKNDTMVSFEQLQFYKTAFKNAVVRELPGKEHVFSKGLPELVADIRSL